MFIRAFYLFISLSFPTMVASGQLPHAATPEMAQRAFDNGRYELALFQYNQIAFNQLPEVDPDIQLKIGLTYMALNEFQKASTFFDLAYHNALMIELKQSALIHKAKSLLAQQEYALALQELYQFQTDDVNDTLKSTHHLLSAVCHYEMGDFNMAKSSFYKLVDDTLALARIFGKPKEMYRPNSRLAMVLSTILPGSGQFYAGAYQEGVNSLIINSFFIYYSFRVAALYGSIDALISTLPWFQRYYMGGYNKASVLAHDKMQLERKKKLAAILNEIERQQQ